MEFIPICLECTHFQDGGKCPYFDVIPFSIKNREIRCEHYNGEDEEYILFTKDSKPEGSE